MAGNPQNAAVWSEGDVFVSFDPEPATPANVDAPFGIDWDYVGLLNGSTGVAENATSTNTKHYAWGYGAIAETEKDHELTISFTAREDNPVVRQLAYPGDAAVGSVRFGPAVPCFIAYEVREGEKVKRFISRRACKVRRNGDTTRNEDNLEETPFQATILPDDGGHWIIQETDTGS